MPKNKNRYPQVGIRSKNELAKRISDEKLTPQDALKLINDVLWNYDKYWRDTGLSEPEKQKYVRSAKHTPLGRLLKLIDKKVLAPYDYLVPDFIFGGLAGKNHIQAARHLLGEKRERTLLGLDIARFFEQVKEKRVFYFFYTRCGCSKIASNLLAALCCVPLGPKGSGEIEKSIARGFATSTRLALWCSFDTFLRISWEAKNQFRGHDPRIAIYVDDIGITASRIDHEKVEAFSLVIEGILSNAKLSINPKKKKIKSTSEGAEHLGIRLGRNKLTIGGKASSKLDNIRNRLKEPTTKAEKIGLLISKKSLYSYKQQIKKS